LVRLECFKPGHLRCDEIRKICASRIHPSSEGRLGRAWRPNCCMPPMPFDRSAKSGLSWSGGESRLSEWHGGSKIDRPFFRHNPYRHRFVQKKGGVLCSLTGIIKLSNRLTSLRLHDTVVPFLQFSEIIERQALTSSLSFVVSYNIPTSPWPFVPCPPFSPQFNVLIW
jgi:hypothetical protein